MIAIFLYPASTSPKQYLLLTLDEDLTLPLSNRNVPEKTLFKKAKGVRRGIIADSLSTEDFIEVGVLNHPSRSMDSYGFKKFMFTVFLNKTHKKLLSRGNTKRLFLEHSRTDESFFSLPLFVKHIPNNNR